MPSRTRPLLVPPPEVPADFWLLGLLAQLGVMRVFRHVLVYFQTLSQEADPRGLLVFGFRKLQTWRMPKNWSRAR